MLPLHCLAGETMTKRAQPAHPVHELLSSRWSPYGFSDRSVSSADLCSLFEAARWAPSSYNEQPWRFLVATCDEPAEFARLLSCLVEPNQAWARYAPVLALHVASLKFARNDRDNTAAIHDLGLAAANLTLEATARGIAVHQMIGILPDRARELYAIPEGFTAVTGLAIGYAGEAQGLDAKFLDRDRTARTRKPLEELVFTGRFGQVHPKIG
jgi:nitroreductase